MLACRDTPRGDPDGNPIFYDCLTFSNRAQGSFVSKWDLTGQAESILSDPFVLMKVKQGYNVVGGLTLSAIRGIMLGLQVHLEVSVFSTIRYLGEIKNVTACVMKNAGDFTNR